MLIVSRPDLLPKNHAGGPGPDLDCRGPWAISLRGPGQCKCERGGSPLRSSKYERGGGGPPCDPPNTSGEGGGGGGGGGGSFLQLIHSKLATF